MNISLIDIEQEFRDIATSHNIQGDSVELIIKLLSYNRLKTLTSVDNTLLEFLPDTSVNINNKIAHAANEMYSVGRGYNPVIKLKASVTGNVSLKKYDRVYTDKNNTLFFLSAIGPDGKEVDGDYHFTWGEVYELTLLKADKKYTEKFSVDINNKFIIETLSDNISEEYRVTDGDGATVLCTKDFGQHIDSSINNIHTNKVPLAFALTLPGYGLRIYSPSSDELKGGFQMNKEYTIEYFTFMDEIVELEDLQKLKITGFKLDLETISIKHRVERESTANFLYNLKRNCIVQSRTRTNSDIVDYFKIYFANKIRDASMGGYIPSNNTVNIRYIPTRSNDLLPADPKWGPFYEETLDISTNAMAEFGNSIMYYVTNDFTCEPVTDKDAIILGLELDIKIYDKLPTDSLIALARSYEYILGKDFVKAEFIGKVNDFPEVRYCSLKVMQLTDPKAPKGPTDPPFVPKEITDLELSEDTYLLLENKLSYNYLR
jgi:hypothetical protein